MEKHIEKGKLNEKFYDFLINNAPSEFIEWQITTLFYSALHYVKALLVKKKLPRTNTHEQLEKVINPKNHHSPFDETSYYLYNELYRSSRSMRYDVYPDNSDFKFVLIEYKRNEAFKHFTELKKNIRTLGLKI